MINENFKIFSSLKELQESFFEAFQEHLNEIYLSPDQMENLSE